jgi:hypothetical protein
LFPARAIDPREATLPYVRRDDVHFGSAGGRAWAAFVKDSVQTALTVVPEPPRPPRTSSTGLPGWTPWIVGGLAAATVFAVWRFARR